MLNSIDFSALLQLAGLGALLAGLALLLLRLRNKYSRGRQHALIVLTLFLTFDLVLFGAFTRLTDSGLGCPDWPGCYGQASPIGASTEIAEAQAAMPSGPVTHGKAWIEMIHRYLASAVGVLILLACLISWRQARRGEAAKPWWATLTLLWVCMQGAFGALTVTMKLFPAIVTLHLLGGMGLLMLLAWQAQGLHPAPLRLGRKLYIGAWAVLLLLLLQVALGAWVSTNYAVLACNEFPTCQGGQWWPAQDYEQGFTLWRELGVGSDGNWLQFAALTAIHMAHRLGALLVFAALLAFALALWRDGRPTLQVWAKRLLLVAAWQLVTGLSNSVLDWPLLAALAHTGGAAMLLLLLSLLLARAQQARQSPIQDNH
jgi:cytochrome c oxidase assembly protein subunit 15